MAASIPIILNPAARSTQAGARLEQLSELEPAPVLHLTHSPGQATEIAESLAREGRELVVAAGGDGTVNEVLQGICRANAERPDPAGHTALGVLPMGTMNVFSLELGMPGQDLRACWQLISSGNRTSLDLWQANDHYFVQLAGVGLDAAIIEQTPWELKKKFGPLSYVISAAQVFMRQAPVLTVSMEGKPPMQGSVVLVGSGKNYGGAFPVFRQASNTDGLLDVLIFRQFGYWEIAQLLRAVLVDGYENAHDLDYFQVREFTVTAKEEVPVEVDGELSGNTPVTFKPAPFLLRVAV